MEEAEAYSPYIKAGLTKYFGKCEIPSGGIVYLSVHASSEAEASERLHHGYVIAFVWDILTPLDMLQHRKQFRRSMLGSSPIHH
jgi:hypothetical protein